MISLNGNSIRVLRNKCKHGEIESKKIKLARLPIYEHVKNILLDKIPELLIKKKWRTIRPRDPLYIRTKHSIFNFLMSENSL
jgi:hypothetical protein